MLPAKSFVKIAAHLYNPLAFLLRAAKPLLHPLTFVPAAGDKVLQVNASVQIAAALLEPRPAQEPR